MECREKGLFKGTALTAETLSTQRKSEKDRAEGFEFLSVLCVSAVKI
jgi:hypothetical protein